MPTWLVVPLPEWPMLIVPGLARHSATTLFMSVKRLSARVTTSVGTVVRMLTGANWDSISFLPAKIGAT